MKKLIQHQETEYDFDLIFRNVPAPKVGDEVKSGVIDSDGQMVVFSGTAYVVATVEEISDSSKTIVYVRQFNMVKQYNLMPNPRNYKYDISVGQFPHSF